MTQQWIRKASLIIGSESDALDLSGLHFRFSVQQQDIQTPSKRRYSRVHNVSEATAKRARDWVEGGRC